MATYKITNPKGEVKSNLTREQVKEFKMALSRRNPPILDPKAAGYILEEESESIVEEEPQNTTPEERADYFKGTPAAFAAQLFPNLAERNMQGNDGFNLGTVRAGIADVASLPGRAVAGINNAILGDGTFDLGRRAGEDTGFIETIARDPTTPIVAGAGKVLAGGVNAASNAGKYLLGNTLGRPGIGSWAGGAIGGAAEGAGIEAASAGLNDREITPAGLAVGAGLGGVFEGLGTGAQVLLQKYGKNFVKSAAQALRLGNTDRPLTDSELKDFLSDERNVSALRTVLDKGSEGRNMTPFVGDRGKKLKAEVEKARQEAESTLKGEDAFKGFEEGIDPNLSIGEQNEQRKLNALRMKNEGETENMNLATPYKEKKNSSYKPNAYKYIDKFFSKYNKIQSKVLEKPSVERPMSQDESFLLNQLKKEMEVDKNVVSGYTPEKVISENKFLSDRTPFNDEFYENSLKPFLDGNKNVSHEFLTELHRILGGTKVAMDKSTELREALSGLEETSLKRAFTKSDKNIEVRKGYDNAMKKFKDTLSDYAEMRVGRPGVNAKGEDYIVGDENMKKYVFTYLRHFQDDLKRNGALKPDEIVSLYGMATNVNDKTVQDAIIQLLRDLKVPENTVKKFEQVGGSYAMLNKARTRMKKNANEDNPFKGTMAAPIYPQEGFNAANAVGWRLQGGNINLGDLSTTNNSTRIGRGVRQAVYNLGLPYARTRE